MLAQALEQISSTRVRARARARVRMRTRVLLRGCLYVSYRPQTSLIQICILIQEKRQPVLVLLLGTRYWVLGTRY
jgi:hypothetical protein